MGMKLTNALLAEHAVFYAQFDHLERALPLAGSLPEILSPAALLAAALATHAHLEDELLFTALDPHLGQAGPLSVMRSEHEEIEGGLNRLPEIGDLEEARRLARHVVETAREHFAKEERVLFRMAEHILGPETLAALGARWAEARGVEA